MTERVIRIVIDDSGVRTGTANINQQLDNVDKRAASASRGLKAAAVAAAAFTAALGVREFTQYADTLTQLQSQLRLVTDSNEELAATQADLFDLAQDTRSSFEGTVELYARVARSTEDLNLSQNELLEVTQTVNQAIQISGATAQEAGAGVIQFAQGLASGALRGDELRSVLENTPALARALAEGLTEVGTFGEVGIGQLRELGAEGALTAEIIIEALGNVSEDVAADFAKLERTTDQALTQLQNSFLRLVGEINDEFDVSGGVNNVIDQVRELVDFTTDELVGPLADAFEAVGIAFEESLGSVDFSFAIEETEEFQGVLAATVEVAKFVGEAFELLPANVAAAIRLITFETTQGFNELQLAAAEAVNSVAEFFGGEAFSAETIRELQDDVIFGEQALVQLRNQEFQTLEDIRLKIEETKQLRQEQREEEKRALEETRAALRQGSGEGGGSAGPTFNEDDIADAEKFIEKTREAAAELRVQREAGDDAAEALIRYRAAQIASGDISDDLKENIASVTDELIRQQQLTQQAADEAARADFIETLEQEAELLKLTNDEREVQVALLELGAEATEEQKQQVRELVGEIQELRDAQEEAFGFTEVIAEQTSIAIRGLIKEAFTGEFDNIQGEFADFLSELGQELLTSLFLQLLADSFGSLGGPFGSVFSQAFGGTPQGRQFGGQVSEGQPVLVGEGGRAEVFIPRENGRIEPIAAGGNSTVVIVNEQDPEAIVSGLETRSGIKAQRNRVTADQRQFRRTLGLG